MPVTEQEKATLSQKRGKLAAAITDPEAKKKFISEQGDIDAKKGGSKDEDYAELYNKTQGEELSQQLKGYKKGGIVKKTGPALVHKGEKIIPKDEVKAHPSTKTFFHTRK